MHAMMGVFNLLSINDECHVSSTIVPGVDNQSRLSLFFIFPIIFMNMIANTHFFFFIYYSDNTKNYLLPPQKGNLKNRKCLVLDLDETLVHSSFKPVPNADFIVHVEIERVIHDVCLDKRIFFSLTDELISSFPFS